MIVRDLEPAVLRQRLQHDGLRLRTGPVVTSIKSSVDAVISGIKTHYAEHTVEDKDTFADFHVSVERPVGPRRWFRPQVLFRHDGDPPFAPLPGDQGFPLLEWGLNWCISAHCHQYLIIHAAVVERGGRAVVMPAPPGSGKSTLCAGLTFSGWRLLSDELALLRPDSGELVPLARPISLKNASIDVIRRFAPDAVLGPVVHETTKGSIAHCKPPRPAVLSANLTAMPAWVVLPRYVPGAPPRLEPLPKAQAMMRLVESTFNYSVLGSSAFRMLGDLVDRCDCFEFSYSRLEDAADSFAELADAKPGKGHS